MRSWLPLAAVLTLAFAAPAAADTVEAACELYPAGSDRLETMLPCSFSQSQGYVTIALADGRTFDLEPVGDAPGNFRDAQGRAVYRQSGLGDQGQIFRLPEISIYVYWDTAALHPEEADNPTAPFSTADYDATTLLPCRVLAETAFGQCPAGILRMEDGQASIVVQDPQGAAFTINFLKDTVNATNRTAEARLDGDTWTVTIDGNQVYEVPLAAIIGD